VPEVPIPGYRKAVALRHRLQPHPFMLLPRRNHIKQIRRHLTLHFGPISDAPKSSDTIRQFAVQ
jgi:hypothetical protein